jgi:hypothetical protein
VYGHTLLLSEKSTSEWWCVDFKKIASIEYDCQKTDVRSESNAIYAADCQEVLHGSSVWLLQFCCNFVWTFPGLSFHVCNHCVFWSGVCTDRVRLPFVSATFNVSQRDGSNRRNTLAFGWRRPASHNACARAALQARLFLTPRIIRSELTPAVCSTSWEHLTTRCFIWQVCYPIRERRIPKSQTFWEACCIILTVTFLTISPTVRNFIFVPYYYLHLGRDKAISWTEI